MVVACAELVAMAFGTMCGRSRNRGRTCTGEVVVSTRWGSGRLTWHLEATVELKGFQYPDPGRGDVLDGRFRVEQILESCRNPKSPHRLAHRLPTGRREAEPS